MARRKPTRQEARPPELKELPIKFKYRELIHHLQKEPYFARAIHEWVVYGRKGDAQAAEADIEFKKIMLPLEAEQLEELGYKGTSSEKKLLSNNTTFEMLDFTRYI